MWIVVACSRRLGVVLSLYLSLASACQTTSNNGGRSYKWTHRGEDEDCVELRFSRRLLSGSSTLQTNGRV